MKLRRQYPTSTVCRALGVPRSTAYYRRRTPDEKALKAALVVLAGRWPTYGYRRLTAELRRTDSLVPPLLGRASSMPALSSRVVPRDLLTRQQRPSIRS